MMNEQAIEQAWDRLQLSARYGTQIYRPDDVYELRQEMKVMGKMIELSLDTKEQADYREQAEAELKGASK